MTKRMEQNQNAKKVQLALFREYGFQPCLKDIKILNTRDFDEFPGHVEALYTVIKGETVKLYPVMVYLAESDQYENIGYDEEAPRILLPGWRDYQKCGYNESYSLAPVAYNEMSDRVYFVLPEGASVYADGVGCPVIDYDDFKQDDVINQYDGNGCRPYIIDSDRRRTYLEVVEL